MIERLRQEMARLGINARELSSRARIGRSFVYDLLSGRSSNPTTNKMSAIADALGVSLPYLLSGSENDNSESNYYGNFISVPLFVGSIKNNSQGVSNGYLFNKDWITEHLKVVPENLQMFIINGGGMYPTIKNNDTLMVDKSCKNPVKPGIFILFSNSSIIARRMEFVPGNKPGQVFVSPDNPKYAPHTCDINEMEIVGRVVWVARDI